jgi:hypothetical protein
MPPVLLEIIANIIAGNAVNNPHSLPKAINYRSFYLRCRFCLTDLFTISRFSPDHMFLHLNWNQSQVDTISKITKYNNKPAGRKFANGRFIWDKR